MTTSEPAPYRHYIQPNADAEFPAEKDRYHLYITYSCPFACRALSARNLKGLQDVIGVSVAHPIFQKTKPSDENDTHLGWTFFDPQVTPTVTAVNGKQYSTEGATIDHVNGVKFVRDLYELVDKEPRRYTVPLLWDKKKKTIVSNESADILRTLNTGFRDLVPSNVDLVPADREEEINALNDGIVAEVTGAYFKITFSQDADGVAAGIAAFFEAVEKLDKLLASTRYLAGNTITEPDVRMFHTLIRADIGQKAATEKNLTQYANVVGYLRDLYQNPALKATVYWPHLMVGLVNHKPNAPPVEGPFVDYDAPHDRATLQ